MRNGQFVSLGRHAVPTPGNQPTITELATPPRAAADDTTVRPFHINVPEPDLVDLRRRIAAKLSSLPQFVTTIDGLDIQFWAEQSFQKLIYWHEVDTGGHFAAWEQPQLFAEEFRVAFRSLR